MNYSPRQLGDLTPTNPNRRQGLLAVFDHVDAMAGLFQDSAHHLLIYRVVFGNQDLERRENLAFARIVIDEVGDLRIFNGTNTH